MLQKGTIFFPSCSASLQINIINALKLITNRTYWNEVFPSTCLSSAISKVTSVPLQPRPCWVFDLKSNNLLFRFQFRYFRSLVFAFQYFGPFWFPTEFSFRNLCSLHFSFVGVLYFWQILVFTDIFVFLFFFLPIASGRRLQFQHFDFLSISLVPAYNYF